MICKTLTPEELRPVFETHLKEASPPSELKPLAAMEDLRRKGVYDPLGFFDEEGELMGVLLL